MSDFFSAPSVAKTKPTITIKAVTHPKLLAFMPASYSILRLNPNFLLLHLERNLEQTRSLARAARAQSRQWIVNRPVRFAHNLLPIAREELIVPVINRQRQVPANIFVNNDLALKKRRKTVARNSFTPEFEFHRLLPPQLLQPRDNILRHLFAGNIL